MSEKIPDPTNHQEDNIKIQGPFTNNQVYNEQLQEPLTNNQVYNGQLQALFTNQELNGQLQDPFTNNQVYNGQLQAPFTNQEYDGQLQAPFINNQEFNGQAQGPFINNLEFNGQAQGPFINNQIYNGPLQQPLTNNQKVSAECTTRKVCVCIFATIILFIEAFLNFSLIMSDIFMYGIYGPSKKVEKHLTKVFIFGLLCAILSMAMLILSLSQDDPKKSYNIILILLIIKLLLYTGYFIFLYLDREGKEIRLIVIIPELALNAIILINENLKKKNIQNVNN